MIGFGSAEKWWLDTVDSCQGAGSGWCGWEGRGDGWSRNTAFD